VAGSVSGGGDLWATRWEAVVAASFETIKVEAERRAR
jgi:hypothetical protein